MSVSTTVSVTPTDRKFARKGHTVARPSFVRELYEPRYDYPDYEREHCRLEYMLAAVPRSGSTYLALEMWRTGVMGAPMEYTNPLFRDVMRRRCARPGNLSVYWTYVKRHRTSPNGVFGYKTFIMDYLDCMQRNAGFLSRITPSKVILLTRRDLVAQAVSYSKAIQSGTWFGGVPIRCVPVYNASHIWWCLNALKYQRDFWLELLRLTGTTPLELVYEDLISNPGATLMAIADFLGVTLKSEGNINLVRVPVQRNSESLEWCNRFKKTEYKGL